MVWCLMTRGDGERQGDGAEVGDTPERRLGFFDGPFRVGLFMIIFAFSFLGAMLLYFGTLGAWEIRDPGVVTRREEKPNGEAPRIYFSYVVGGRALEDYSWEPESVAGKLQPGVSVDIMRWPFWPYFAQLRVTNEARAAQWPMFTWIMAGGLVGFWVVWKLNRWLARLGVRLGGR